MIGSKDDNQKSCFRKVLELVVATIDAGKIKSRGGLTNRQRFGQLFLIGEQSKRDGV